MADIIDEFQYYVDRQVNNDIFPIKEQWYSADHLELWFEFDNTDDFLLLLEIILDKYETEIFIDAFLEADGIEGITRIWITGNSIELTGDGISEKNYLEYDRMVKSVIETLLRETKNLFTTLIY